MHIVILSLYRNTDKMSNQNSCATFPCGNLQFIVTNVPESWHAEKISFKNTSRRQLTADELGLEG